MEALKRIIAESKNIVFFGGAGVSTESGIPDFRGASGVFQQKYQRNAEVILSNYFFSLHPEEFYDFYYAVMLHPQAQPNSAHLALAKLEKAGKLKAVITQNIDDLHTQAGSREVLELHGSVTRNYCTKCHQFYDLETFLKRAPYPKCDCGGWIKPDVVLYGEPLDNDIFDRAEKYIESCDTLIIGGTSLQVYPANGLIHHFHGKNLVLIDPAASKIDTKATLVIKDKIGHTLEFVNHENEY